MRWSPPAILNNATDGAACRPATRPDCPCVQHASLASVTKHDCRCGCQRVCTRCATRQVATHVRLDDKCGVQPPRTPCTQLPELVCPGRELSPDLPVTRRQRARESGETGHSGRAGQGSIRCGGTWADRRAVATANRGSWCSGSCTGRGSGRCIGTPRTWHDVGPAVHRSWRGDSGAPQYCSYIGSSCAA
eukprot:364588-Chlamydomonas_euryale.AAC.8